MGVGRRLVLGQAEELGERNRRRPVRHVLRDADPAARAAAIVKATTHFDDPEILLQVSRGLRPGMKGLEMSEIPEQERLAVRGW